MQVNGGVWQERLIVMSILLNAIKLSQALTADKPGEKWWNTRRVQTNRRMKDLLKKQLNMECIQALDKQNSEINKKGKEDVLRKSFHGINSRKSNLGRVILVGSKSSKIVFFRSRKLRRLQGCRVIEFNNPA